MSGLGEQRPPSRPPREQGGGWLAPRRGDERVGDDGGDGVPGGDD